MDRSQPLVSPLLKLQVRFFFLTVEEYCIERWYGLREDDGFFFNVLC
jgi:hypothetical protein